MKYVEKGHYFRNTDERLGVSEFRVFEQEKRKEAFEASRGEELEKSILSAILGILVVATLIWFIASGVTKSPLLFHAMLSFLISVSFLVCHSFWTSDTFEKNELGINMPIVASGLCSLALIAIEVLYLLHDTGVITIPVSGVILAASIFLAISGVVVLVTSVMKSIHLKSVCTVETQATCIGFDDRSVTADTDRCAHLVLESCPVYEFNYGGSVFTVYDKVYTEDDSLLPHIGDTVDVKFSSDDPNVCIINDENKFRPGTLLIGIILIACAMIGLAVMGAVKERFSSDNRRRITDSLIAEYLKVSEDEVPEYIVFERVITEPCEGGYYFEETAGLNRGAQTDEKFEAGEHVYWVEVYGRGVILYDMDDFCYEGTKTPANSDRYDANGKCYISDAYVKDHYGFDTFEVTPVKYVGIANDIITFEAEDGTVFSMRASEDAKKKCEGAATGDAYYWVALDNSVDVLDGDLYTLPSTSSSSSSSSDATDSGDASDDELIYASF